MPFRHRIRFFWLLFVHLPHVHFWPPNYRAALSLLVLPHYSALAPTERRGRAPVPTLCHFFNNAFPFPSFARLRQGRFLRRLSFLQPLFTTVSVTLARTRCSWSSLDINPCYAVSISSFPFRLRLFSSAQLACSFCYRSCAHSNLEASFPTFSSILQSLYCPSIFTCG